MRTGANLPSAAGRIAIPEPVPKKKRRFGHARPSAARNLPQPATPAGVEIRQLKAASCVGRVTNAAEDRSPECVHRDPVGRVLQQRKTVAWRSFALLQHPETKAEPAALQEALHE